MSKGNDTSQADPGSGLFRTAGPRERPSVLPWVLAGVVIVLVAAAVFLTTRADKRSPATAQAAAAYSSSLAMTDLQMSESSALSGVKVTYIDGQIRNLGPKTVIGATAQVVFSNDEQLPPQLETVPLTVIRTHEPYIDTQTLAAAPLGPGEQREFRLIFENLSSNWNQQLPVIRLTEVSTR